MLVFYSDFKLSVESELRLHFFIRFNIINANQMQNQNPSRLHPSLFPALRAVLMYHWLGHISPFVNSGHFFGLGLTTLHLKSLCITDDTFLQPWLRGAPWNLNVRGVTGYHWI